MKHIPFNKPFLVGKELEYIEQAVQNGKISGNGIFTKKCQSFFEDKLGAIKSLLTTSCTDSLEMAALLTNIAPGDEVIMPSFTFVSTAIAFVRQGAIIKFADSMQDNPNIDVDSIQNLINKKTKLIIPVHYSGVACNMDLLKEIACEFNLTIVEDAAQAIDSYYKGKPLGSIGDLGCFSFHETKNIQCGEGGLLAINREEYFNRAEIIWEKGTNRAEFFRGQIDKYGWVDIGSSFLPSEITAAFLYAQIEYLENIQIKRKTLWNRYYLNLKELENRGYFKLPIIPSYATNNAHMFYILTASLVERSELIEFLKNKGIMAVFHYQSLHMSSYYNLKHDGRILKNAEMYSDRLLRLPLFNNLSIRDVDYISSVLADFYSIK